MSMQPDAALRRFPLTARNDLKPASEAGANRVIDLTHRPRIGIRGRATMEWCKANDLPFPDAVNTVAAAKGFRVARLGRYEILAIRETDAPPPPTFFTLPEGAYSACREDGWAWFRVEGPETLSALATMTSADLRPAGEPADRVFQTRLAGLDAVLLVSGAEEPVADVFFDIASSAYFCDVVAERRPDFTLCKAA